MVDIIKQSMADIWASSGDVQAPDSAKIATGWVVEAVPRQWWNWFENRQDTNIAYMLQKGIPEWDATTEYLTNKSYVQRNGTVYKCILTGTNKDPSTTPANWVKAFPESSVYLEAIRPLPLVNNTMAFINGSGVAQNTTTTAFGRSVLNIADAAAGRTLIGAQTVNSNLTALSAVAAATNVLPFFTSTTAMGTTNLTAFGRSLLDDADAAAGRTTLDLGNAAILNSTADPLDFTPNRLMKTGAFGMGGALDVRSSAISSGVPGLLFNIGTVHGYANGGTDAPGGLGIPGLGTSHIGVLTVQAHSAYIQRRFVSSLTGEEYTQWTLNPTTWSAWIKNLSTATATPFGESLIALSNALSARVAIGSDNASNLTAGTIPAARVPTLNQSTTGNAATATQLQTARTINGVSFNGTANIVVTDSTKEPLLPTGGGDVFLAGNKTLRNLGVDIRQNTVLTGLVTTNATPIVATDVIIQAFGKLQAQADTFAKKGANADITRLIGLTTPLSMAQGGTGATNKPAVAKSLGLLPGGETLSGVNLDTLFVDGSYYMNSPVNSPGGPGWIIVQGVDGVGGNVYCGQQFLTLSGLKFYRTRIANVWRPWKQDLVYSFASLTGQPTDNAFLATALNSKLSIVATGGTNLNGWIKYSDNTIEQWGTVSVAQNTEGTVFSFNTPFTSFVKVFQCTSAQYPRSNSAEVNNSARAESPTQFRVMSGHAATPAPFTWYAKGI